MIYWFVIGLLKLFTRVIFRVKIEGYSGLPLRGPVVLAANHISLWDPILVAAASRRPVHFMAKEELFRAPVLGKLLPHLKAFPVRRGENDRDAIRSALAVLSKGGVLGIFVEGTRNKGQEVMPLKRGAAMLASRGEATIIPVAIQRVKRRITIKFGTPLTPQGPLVNRRTAYELVSRGLQEALINMLEPVPQQ